MTKTTRYQAPDPHAGLALSTSNSNCPAASSVGVGSLNPCVRVHVISCSIHYQHGLERFLPWHRVYLILMEHALQAIHPDVTIPYWDWTKATEENLPEWLASFTPTVPMPPPMALITVIRSPGRQSWLATLASNIPTIEGIADFASFTTNLEGVHVWVGGTMSAVPTAPADPIFWMHHANIDRLWWDWQQAHPGENPNLTGTSATSPVMDPWAYTEPQTRDITTLGYGYV